jgi:hypothetical protein
MTDASPTVEIIGGTLKEFKIRHCGINPETGEPWPSTIVPKSSVAPEVVAVWMIKIKEIANNWDAPKRMWSCTYLFAHSDSLSRTAIASQIEKRVEKTKAQSCQAIPCNCSEYH